MKRLQDVSLTPNQRQALAELRRRLFDEFDIKTMILYGSVARGEADEESDLDLLILTTQPLTRFERHRITDAVFEVNLRCGTNISTLVVDHRSWSVGALVVLPIRHEILEEGITL